MHILLTPRRHCTQTSNTVAENSRRIHARAPSIISKNYTKISRTRKYRCQTHGWNYKPKFEFLDSCGLHFASHTVIQIITWPTIARSAAASLDSQEDAFGAIDMSQSIPKSASTCSANLRIVLSVIMSECKNARLQNN